MHSELIVRAVDVGYGHTKFTSGRDSAGLICTDSIPSQSPAAKESRNNGKGVMGRHDTFIVPVGDRSFEVGHDIGDVVHGNHVSEVMNDDYSLTDAYTARLFGAFNYMAPNLPDDTIDVLVMGLPLNTFGKHHEAVTERFLGGNLINNQGGRVEVKSCHVYPQPLGSYASYLKSNPPASRPPLALIVDPGYNTVDWFVCRGMVANDIRSDAVQRGMGTFMRALADDLIKKHGFDASHAEVTRAIDKAFSNNTPFELYTEVFDLTPHMAAGDDIIEEAAQSVKNSVGSGSDLDAIVLTGGGATFYAKAIQSKFPRIKVTILESPSTANVRGFHQIGEMLAESRKRAISRRPETGAAI